MGADPPADHTAAARPAPARVLVASRDQTYASVLARSLLDQGLEAVVWPRPWRELPAPDCLGWLDVLLLETGDLTDAEWDLIEGIREASPVAEVIAISSDPLLEDAVQALRAGVFAVLEYPVSSDQLVKEISRACERKRHGERRLRQLGDEQRWGDRGVHRGAGEGSPTTPTNDREEPERRPR